MSAVFLYTEVPSNVDPEYVRLNAPKQLRDWLRKLSREVEEDEAQKRALESDLALQEWLDKASRNDSRPHPVVRQKVYGDIRVNGDQLLPGWYGLSGDPRMPVLLRGSFEAIGNRYQRGVTDFAEKVGCRYLRQIKYTCFDQEEHLKRIREITRRVEVKFLDKKLYLKSTFGFAERVVGLFQKNWSSYIDGEHQYLSHNDYIRLCKKHGERRTAHRAFCRA